jgi:hypothetical protein
MQAFSETREQKKREKYIRSTSLQIHFIGRTLSVSFVVASKVSGFGGALPGHESCFVI